MAFHLIIRPDDFCWFSGGFFLMTSHPFQPSDSDPPNVLPETLQLLLLIATSQGSWPSRNASVCRSALDQAAFAKRQTKNERVLEKELGWSVRFFDGICITLKCICIYIYVRVYIYIYIIKYHALFPGYSCLKLSRAELSSSKDLS